MEFQYNSAHIDLQNLIKLARGDKDRMLKYLNQFQNLIPKRAITLKKYLAEEDRKMIRQIVHQMSPQLQFFGIPNVIAPITRIEQEYLIIDINSLQSIVNEILLKLKKALDEVIQILKLHF